MGCHQLLHCRPVKLWLLLACMRHVTEVHQHPHITVLRGGRDDDLCCRRPRCRCWALVGCCAAAGVLLLLLLLRGVWVLWV